VFLGFQNCQGEVEEQNRSAEELVRGFQAPPTFQESWQLVAWKAALASMLFLCSNSCPPEHLQRPHLTFAASGQQPLQLHGGPQQHCAREQQLPSRLPAAWQRGQQLLLQMSLQLLVPQLLLPSPELQLPPWHCTFCEVWVALNFCGHELLHQHRERSSS